MDFLAVHPVQQSSSLECRSRPAEDHEPIRIALGEVHSAMLRDILSQIADSQPDMELVGAAARPDLKDAIASQKPDVLICDVRPDELPQVCRELFADPDPPVVVGLAREGREAAVCIANAGAAQLMSVIRSATLDAGEDSNVVELFRPRRRSRRDRRAEPYASNADCLNDQLRCLDLALLAEIDAFESTVWDESAQRLQGLAISPGEVRALLQRERAGRAAACRAESLRRRRCAPAGSGRPGGSPPRSARPDAPPFVRLVERFGLGRIRAVLRRRHAGARDRPQQVRQGVRAAAGRRHAESSRRSSCSCGCTRRSTMPATVGRRPRVRQRRGRCGAGTCFG